MDYYMSLLVKRSLAAFGGSCAPGVEYPVILTDLRQDFVCRLSTLVPVYVVQH